VIFEKISIIIPAYNCEKTIGRTLEAALTVASAFRNAPISQTQNRYVEIIVVDDGSTDNTKNVILKFSTVKYCYQSNAGPASARNRGAQEACGDILFFTDSDCLPHKDWLEIMMAHFNKPDVAVVAGSYGIANSQNRLSRCIQQEIIFRHTILMPEFPNYFGSFNFAIKKSVFNEVGGFNVTYRFASGEDNDLSYRISSRGYKIYFAKDALVDHYHPVSVSQYLREQFRHGFWRVRMYRDYPQMAKGDGYTFWKDSVEVALVVICYVLFALILLKFSKLVLWVFIGNGMVLIAINIFFGMRISADWHDGLFFSDVMILRAFARTNGFLSGACRFCFGKNE
jgi:glycosyltransferase involved in cell wall biosynthesis